MDEIEKIGMYSTDEILEFMTEGEGRGFLGRSMFDAMYFKINNLQSKIDKANELIKRKLSTETYQHLKKLYDDIDSTEEIWENYEFEDLLDILN